MEKCKNSRIGSIEQKGISGGERKRTSIAYEIISNPQVIIVDEPTTGMDSYTSLVLMKYLQKLALNGKTIICTIHQPGSEIFHLVDRILLMKQGQMVYFDKANKMLKYFNEKLNFAIPKFCNPFDFALTVLQNKSNSADELYNNYKENQEAKQILIKNQNNDKYSNKEIIKLNSKYNSISWISEFLILFQRGWIDLFRNRNVLYAKLVQYFFNTLILLGFYFDIGGKTNLFFNLLGFSFNITNNLFIVGMFNSIFAIPVVRKILKREYSAKMYNISSFYVQYIILLFVPSFFYSIMLSPALYYGIQLENKFSDMLIFFVMNFLYFSLSEGFGTLCGAAFGDQLSLIISPLFFILFMLGSGFFRSNNSFPSALKWLNWISPYKYMMELYLRLHKNFSLETAAILDKMGYTMGIQNCLIILFSIWIVCIFFGFIAVKNFAAKF